MPRWRAYRSLEWFIFIGLVVGTFVALVVVATLLAAGQRRNVIVFSRGAAVPSPSPGQTWRSPEVEFTSPWHVYPNITDLSSFHVEFIRPVAGVQAGHLTVNGALAKHVSGSGAGPYLFTGYLVPPPGEVQITLTAGSIRDQQTGTPFAGESWTFHLFDSAADDDGDGVTNGQEIEWFADPTKVDTDDDGLPDAYELAHPCLKVYVNEALPSDQYGVVVPGDDDADDDGVANLEEFRRGTNPCPL